MFLKTSCMLLCAGALFACGTSASTYQFRGQEVAAGADADLRIVERDQNFELDLTVENLLPPQRTIAGAQTYAVWLQPQGQPPTHLGNLVYDEGRRRGQLTTITPHRSFDMFITAESTSTPTEPRGPTVLSESVHED